MLFPIRILGILLTFRINPSVMSCSKFNAESKYVPSLFVDNSIGYFIVSNQKVNVFEKNCCFYVGTRPAGSSREVVVGCPKEVMDRQKVVLDN